MNPNLDHVSRVAVPIIVFVIALAVGADIMEQQVRHIEDTKLEMCEKHFDENFSKERINGELVCISENDGELYQPKVKLLNGVLHYLKVFVPVLAAILVYLAVKIVPPSRSQLKT